jgi:hypothetical protein
LRIAKAGASRGEAWLAELESWISQPRVPGDDEVKRGLAERVPEYTPAVGSLNEAQEKG